MTAAERLAESEAITAAATEGPWEAGLRYGDYYVLPPYRAESAPEDYGLTEADARFATYARSAMPKRDAALRAVLGLCSQAVEQARDWPPNFIGRPCVSVTDLRDAIEEALT